MRHKPPGHKPSPQTDSSLPWDPKAFGKRLRMLREKKGFSLSEFAGRAGVGINGLKRYEAGIKQSPRTRTRHKLAQALGLTHEELVAGLPLRDAEAAAYDGARLLTPGTLKPPPGKSPIYLLNARCRQVEFFPELPGQRSLWGELEAWCRDKEPLAARLVCGAAGMGKTRLLIEFCNHMREVNWRAGFLEERVSPDELERLVESAVQHPTLVVIDYAESRQNLVALLQVAARHRNTGGSGCFRLVLLARSQGEWWEELRRRDSALQGLLEDKPRELTTHELTPPLRSALFLRAANSFSQLLGQTAPSQAPACLGEPSFDRVLFIHMAALATVLGLPLNAETLTASLLNHEERFWRLCHESAQREALPDIEGRLVARRCEQAVTALTLVGGTASRQEANELLLRACGRREEVLLHLLRDLYPGASESRFVAALEPDLLGDALVLRALKAEGTGAGPWLNQVFAGADEQALRRGFRILGRLSTMAKRKSWVDALLVGHVEARAAAALEAARELGGHEGAAAIDQALADALKREGTAEMARELERAGLLRDTARLPGVSEWVAVTLSRSPEPRAQGSQPD